MKKWIIGIALCASLGLGQAQIRAHPDVEALIRRATEARQQQRAQEALTLYQQAIETARTLNDRAGEASAHHNMGVALILMDRPQQAIESLQRALPSGTNSNLQSGLLLAEPAADTGEDGILTARELMELALSAEMVVLSACETARGQARPGEGAIGMVWALTVSGVPTQVLSQWKVSDESTVMLMSHYYKALRAGQSPAAALREAALALRQQKRFQHPYYWAPFICISSW